ncbi:MAG: putative exported fasciclin protein possible adhesin [Micavibrio sp.]|nr:putative exported fasciclin protein possible adhesin [Micavibrio sp.]
MFYKKNFRPLVLCAAFLSFGLTAPALAQTDQEIKTIQDSMKPTPVMVGGAEMSPVKNIVDNVALSKDHSTLIAAIRAADLTGTLSGTGPFTVFAPSNDAFAKLPAGTVDNLLKPENKDKLANILKYHVVPGRLNSASMETMADDNGGKLTLKTSEGEDLIVMKGEDDKWWVSDVSGNKASVRIADVTQSNGVIFVIDTVLMPKAR